MGINEKQDYVGWLRTVSRDLTEQREAKERQDHFTRGLQEVLEMVDELLSCNDINDIYRAAVELPRKRLGIKRTRLMLYDAGDNKLCGLYGTDMSGNTRVETGLSTDFETQENTAFTNLSNHKLRWHLTSDNLIYDLTSSGLKPAGPGWTAVFPLVSDVKGTKVAVYYADCGTDTEKLNTLVIELLALFCSMLTSVLERKQAEDEHEKMAVGLAAVLEMADELTSYDSFEMMLQRAVELPRERLNIDRASIYMIDDDITTIQGTYGTNSKGVTVDEHLHISEFSPAKLNSMVKDNHQWAKHDYKYTEWTEYGNRIFGQGPVGVIPVATRDKILGVLFNDNAISGRPFDEVTQQILTVYCSHLGNIIMRKIAETALRDSDKRMRRITDNMTDIIAQVDKECVFTYISPSIYNMIGIKAEELIGQTFYSLVINDDTDSLRKGFAKVMNGEKNRIESRVMTKFGSIVWIETLANPILSAEGELQDIILTCRNIDQRKKAEEELARSNAELQQFAYIASHDLQEPLRMVASYVQLLQRRYQGKLDGDADTYIKYAVDGATRMKNLINDLLTYSRVGTHGKPLETLPLQETMHRVLDNLTVIIDERKAEVTHGQLPVIMGDSTQMDQLFQNIINNAIKFCQDTPKIHINAVREDNNMWQISIKDNGIGIEPQYAERIFVMFQRLHTQQEYSGTGIGLAVCKKIVERHGGRIWIESEKDKGTTFFFTLKGV
jgi:PAS domain S-box-containing protein